MLMILTRAFVAASIITQKAMDIQINPVTVRPLLERHAR